MSCLLLGNGDTERGLSRRRERGVKEKEQSVEGSENLGFMLVLGTEDFDNRPFDVRQEIKEITNAGCRSLSYG